jgi:hypothetical protein
MSALHVAWRSAGPQQSSPMLSQGSEGRLTGPTALAVRAAPGGPVCLEAALDPAGLTVAASIAAQASHWLRLADASLRPLTAQSGLLTLARGDSYVALVTSGAELDPAQRMAAARFIHLRDYFNAEKLASALLDELAAENGRGLGVLVVECR